MTTIYLAGGCFWGTQHLMRQVRGVVSTRCGYANGCGEKPTYEEVYTDLTGYAECVEVVFDEGVVTLATLLKLFFRSIDPLSLNRQGGDVGTRYRTGIYYTNETLVAEIQDVYEEVQSQYTQPMAVELEPLKNFFPAEEYHQDYLVKNPAGYCHISLALIREAKEINQE